MKRIFTILFSLGLAVCCPAQTTLTLEQCVDEALQNNLKLRRADNDILASAEQRKEAFTKYFPTVSATGMGMAANEHLIQMDLAGMGLNFIKNGVTGSVSAMQPLFAGGQIVNGNKLAQVGEDVSRLQRGLTENEVRLTTETYFWQVVLLKEKLKTVSQVEKQIENVRKDAQAAVDAGIRNRNDLLQVQLRKNEMRTTRIQLENNLGVVKDLLSQYIGHVQDSIDVQTQELTPDMTEKRVGEELSSLYVSPESSVFSTKEFGLLEKQVEANRLNYKLAVGKNLPTVAVGGAYLYNNLLDKSSNKLVGILTVSVPISAWWGGSHDMKKNRIQVQNAENSLTDQSQLLVIRMRKAWNDVQDAYKQIGIAKESITQSEENLRLNTDFYQAGTATISDLLDAQTLYQQSHDKFVEAYTQYEIKKTEYLQATGR